VSLSHRHAHDWRVLSPEVQHALNETLSLMSAAHRRETACLQAVRTSWPWSSPTAALLYGELPIALGFAEMYLFVSVMLDDSLLTLRTAVAVRHLVVIILASFVTVPGLYRALAVSLIFTAWIVLWDAVRGSGLRDMHPALFTGAVCALLSGLLLCRWMEGWRLQRYLVEHGDRLRMAERIEQQFHSLSMVSKHLRTHMQASLGLLDMANDALPSRVVSGHNLNQLRMTLLDVDDHLADLVGLSSFFETASVRMLAREPRAWEISGGPLDVPGLLGGGPEPVDPGSTMDVRVFVDRLGAKAGQMFMASFPGMRVAVVCAGDQASVLHGQFALLEKQVLQLLQSLLAAMLETGDDSPLMLALQVETVARTPGFQIMDLSIALSCTGRWRAMLRAIGSEKSGLARRGDSAADLESGSVEHEGLESKLVFTAASRAVMRDLCLGAAKAIGGSVDIEFRTEMVLLELRQLLETSTSAHLGQSGSMPAVFSSEERAILGGMRILLVSSCPVVRCTCEGGRKRV
jgi:hypothetical protein